MVIRRTIVAAIAATAMLSTWAGPASATGIPTGPPSGGSPQPTGGSSSGSSGGPVHGTVKHCSVYATASSFGLSCLGGGGGGSSPTVAQILAKNRPAKDPDPVPTCWDDRISDSDLQNVYEYTQNPDAPYYLHNCVTGLDPNSAPTHQPNLSLTQQVIEIPTTAAPCPMPYLPAYAGICIMTLTANQQTVVGTFESRGGQIPTTVVATYPSSRVRTGVPTAYVDKIPADLVRKRDGNWGTKDDPVGGVTMYAELDSFAIYPKGPLEKGETCDGTTDVGPSDTPATKPGACWWTYDTSSNDQPDEVYPFRADATWKVYVDGALFATFHKYSYLQLPVFDVQTLVIH